MTDFTSLLSSIGGQSRSFPQTSGPKPASQSSTSNKSQPPAAGFRLVPNNAAAGSKRKSEEPTPAIKSKVARTSSENASIRSPGSGLMGGSSIATSTSVGASSTPYRGTARSSMPANTSKQVPKPVPKPAPRPIVATGTQSAAEGPTVNRGAPKRGFASIMEKAKAAQEAAKATGTSGIKHKAVDKTTKRDRQRQQEEVQQKIDRTKKPTVQNTGTEPPTASLKVTAKKKGQEISYKGTMKKAPAQLAYKGTMRALADGAERPKPPVKKGMGQDKYGGYASWSDLDDDVDEEEEEEEGYRSEGSSDMEAGWGDTEREELQALRSAKEEDQAALEEEERLKRDKLERKRRLQELSRNNAGKRKY